MRLWVALVLFIYCGGPRAAAADVDFGARLADVEKLYGSGDYDAASRVINEMLVRDLDVPAAARAKVYLMKARLELAYGRQAEIRLWLQKAHAANPSLTLDPVKDPPSLIAAWGELPASAKATAGRRADPAEAAAAAKEGGFFMGLLPLGIGHFDADRPKDGALFLMSESFFLLLGATLPQNGDDDARSRARLAASVTVLGAYGYELVDMLPELSHRSPGATTGGLRNALNFIPFGVGQAKNGQTVKAFALGAVDAVLLTAATLAPDEARRRASLDALGAAWAFGILDGFVHENDHTTGAARLEGTVAPLPAGGVEFVARVSL